MKSYLVTNGELADEVSRQVVQVNEDNVRKDRKYSNLEIINGKVLLQEFIQAQETFLPVEPEQVQPFLELFLSDGRGFIDKEKLSTFLDNRMLGQVFNRPADRRNAVLAIIPTLAQALKGFQQRQNHYALFESWTIAAAVILRFALASGMAESDWKESYDLAMQEVIRSLVGLKEEAISKQDLLEGDWLGDGGYIYKARTAIILGAVTALESYMTVTEKGYVPDQRVWDLLKRYGQQTFHWGESAFPFFFSILKFLEGINQTRQADKTRATLLEDTIEASSHGSKMGLAPIYYPPEKVLESIQGVADERLEFAKFPGTSGTLWNWIMMAARRGERSILKANWRKISKIQMRGFMPTSPIDALRWHVDDGTNVSWFPRQTESWAELVKMANEEDDMSRLVKKYRPLFCLWILVCPHRSNHSIIRALEEQ